MPIEKEVNSLLHLLRSVIHLFGYVNLLKEHIFNRGEDFRRVQNQKRSRSHLTTRQNFLPSTLPPVNFDSANEALVPVTSANVRTGRSGISGPPPPPSWIFGSEKGANLSSPEERYDALKPFLERTSLSPLEDPFESIPSLKMMCIQIILTERDEHGRIPLEILPYVPMNLRTAIALHAAIFDPLMADDLVRLYTTEDYEEHPAQPAQLMITDISNDSASFTFSSLFVSQTVRDPTEDWEESTNDVPTLTSMAVLRSSFPRSVISLLPPTLTHLALIHLDAEAYDVPPLWRLPALTPMITFFDLSYNSHWLSRGSKSVLDRVPWNFWTRLTYVGLRESGFDDGYQQKDIRLKITAGKRCRPCTVIFS